MQLRAMILAAGVGLGLALKWLIPEYAGLSQSLPPARPYVSPDATPSKATKKAGASKTRASKAGSKRSGGGV